MSFEFSEEACDFDTAPHRRDHVSLRVQPCDNFALKQ